MDNETQKVFPTYRLVAQFADGQRLTFDGLTEQQAQNRMEAAPGRAKTSPRIQPKSKKFTKFCKTPLTY